MSTAKKGLVLGGLLLAAQCTLGNTSGRLRSQRTGDLSNPLAERSAPRLAAGLPCDAPDAGATSPALRRLPYVQLVAERSATIVWTSMGDAPAQVSVLGTAGELGQFPALLDATARPPDGARQWVAAVTGLEPATSYCYEIGDGDQVLARGELATAPATSDPEASARFVVFGDSGGGGPDQAAVLQQMQTVSFDFLLHTGDIAYETGTRLEFERTFFDVYASLLGRFPLFPVSGNHEYETEDAAPFREVFVLPDNGGADGRERWYSLDWGPLHLVALDTERTGPAQAAWLDADLAAAAAAGRPWVIVLGHRPPFSSGRHGSDLAFRRQFGPVLERHRVPLVLSGHDHNYERVLPQNGISYVVTGGGGRGTRSVGTSAFTAFSSEVLHFVYVTVQGDRLSLHAIDGTGAEFDQLVLRR